VGAILAIVLLQVPVVWTMVKRLSTVPTREDLQAGLEGCRATRREDELLDSQNRMLQALERQQLEQQHQRRIQSKQLEVLRVLPERMTLMQLRASSGEFTERELDIMRIRVDDADDQIEDMHS